MTIRSGERLFETRRDVLRWFWLTDNRPAVTAEIAQECGITRSAAAGQMLRLERSGCAVRDRGGIVRREGVWPGPVSSQSPDRWRLTEAGLVLAEGLVPAEEATP